MPVDTQNLSQNPGLRSPLTPRRRPLAIGPCAVRIPIMSKRKNKHNRHRDGADSGPRPDGASVDVAAPADDSSQASEDLQAPEETPTIVVDADPDDLVAADSASLTDSNESAAELAQAENTEPETDAEESGDYSEPDERTPDQAASDAASPAGKSTRKRKNGKEETIAADIVEALLMTIDRPMPAARIAQVLELETQRPVVLAIETLNAFYEKHARSFRIELVAGGYQILTLPKFKPVLARLHKARGDARLSPAALETLAIIAYKQPILRAELEAIRGVACGEVLRSLMDRHLVKITGRAEEVGRPMLYGTTPTFLELFGLANLKDLPRVEELTRN